MDYKSKPRAASHAKPRRKYQRRAPRVQGTGRISKGSGPQQGTTIISPWMPLFSARTVRQLRYSDSFQLTSTAGTVATYVFAANGMFDPNVTGTGHQPMGFDQMMVFYNHYCVTKARLILVASNASSVPTSVVLRQDASPTPITTIDRILEIGGNSYVHLDAAGSTNAQKELKLSLDIAKLQGITWTALMADSTLRGDSASNPTELSYFHCQVMSAAGFTAVVNFDVLIEFTSYFMEPRDGTAS